jgi:DNA processing protein
MNLDLDLDADLEDAATAGADHPGVRRARAWLSRAAEPGIIDLWRFVDRHGPVSAARLIRSGSAPGRILGIVGARAQTDESLADLQRAERCGARLITPEDDEWPAVPLHALVLATAKESDQPKDQTVRIQAPVPPIALWVRGPGRLDELVDRSVAIVGSRASTAYGEHVAGELGYQLAERGWTVVSGGAYGIDAAAHRGALAAEGSTIAVLACGVDRPYPAGNGALLHRIAESGLVVSEWPPGAAPHQHRFLVRNRLIAGLTRGTVVVEAAARSGAVATANRARKLGKQVMVMPGPVTSAMSVGCHEMLREPVHDGEAAIRLVASAAHVIEEIGSLGADLADHPDRPSDPRDGLSDVAMRVLDACPVRVGVSPERLAGVAGCDALDVLRVLPALELAELVEWTGQGWRLAPQRRPGRTSAG